MALGFKMRRSLVGRTFGLDHKDHLFSNDRVIGRSSSDPLPLAVLADDFLGDLLADEWGVAKGADAAAVDFAVVADINGIARATTGAGAGASTAANGVQLHSFLNWRASTGSLAMTARVKAAAITTLALFVGFTDQIAALEMPINGSGSGNGITTTATDAVGFLFDTTMTNAVWWGVGVANDVDATAVNLGVAPTAATYQTLRVEVEPVGNAAVAKLMIDGRVLGTVSAAVAPTVALTPVIAAFRRSAASTTIDADYVHVESERL